MKLNRRWTSFSGRSVRNDRGVRLFYKLWAVRTSKWAPAAFAHWIDQGLIPLLARWGWVTLPPLDTLVGYSDWATRFDTISHEEVDLLHHIPDRSHNQAQVTILLVTDTVDAHGFRQMIASLEEEPYENWRFVWCGGWAQNESDVRRAEALCCLLDTCSVSKGRTFIDVLSTIQTEHILLLTEPIIFRPQTLPLLHNAAKRSDDHTVVVSAFDWKNVRGKRHHPLFLGNRQDDQLLARPQCLPVSFWKHAQLDSCGTHWTHPFPNATDIQFSLACNIDQVHWTYLEAILFHRIEKKKGEQDTRSMNMKHQERLIALFLEHEGLSLHAEATQQPHLYTRLIYSFPKETSIDILLPSRNHWEDVERCISSIREHSAGVRYHIQLIDNGSDPEQARKLQKMVAPDLAITCDDRPFNYAALMNAAVARSTADVLVFLNNDTVVLSDGWLDTLVSHVLRERVGVVGCKLISPNHTLQHAGIIVRGFGSVGHRYGGAPDILHGHDGLLDIVSNPTAVTFACAAVKRATYQELGGLNQQLFGVNYNDVDFCLRIWSAGMRVVFVPDIVVEHAESGTRGVDVHAAQQMQREERTFRKVWGTHLSDGDPSYDRHFDQEHPTFQLAWHHPPRPLPRSFR